MKFATEHSPYASPAEELAMRQFLHVRSLPHVAVRSFLLLCYSVPFFMCVSCAVCYYRCLSTLSNVHSPYGTHDADPDFVLTTVGVKS